MKSVNKIALFLIVIIFSQIFFLFINTNTIEKNLIQNINKMFINHAQNVAINIDRFIKKYCKDNLYNLLKKDEKLRAFLQDSLTLTAIPPHKYVYILYRDNKGRYRYLLDGSLEDKGEFDQKLDVEDKEWDEVYNSKKDRLIMHNRYGFLYVTYLKPIVINSKVQGIIAIDFTSDFPKKISSLIYPLKKSFNYIFAIFMILSLILIYQFYLYIKTKKSAALDPLTGVYNRAFLRSFIEDINPNDYAIFMIDIDHFKNINDTYGHKAGDFILREFTNILKKILRDEDIIIRYGGEEFLILLKKPSSEKKILEIAQRVKDVVKNYTFLYDKYRLNITISIGITSNLERFKSIKEAIKKADEMLYRAKREGRDKVIFWVEKDKNDKNEIDIYFVKEALEKGRVFCQYQPIFDIKDKKVIKYEALVRLKDEKNNIIYPGAFLQKIAFTTIYNSLTKKVLDIVFENIAKNRKNISINLNFSDITDNVIFSIILKELEKNIELAKYLTIELLENEPLSNQNELKNRLDKLKSFGIEIAIDDFGSGYSNFEIFRFLPIDSLKIDGSLIKDIQKSKISYSIVKSIALFSKDLDIKTVAEFVENREILDILKELEITYAQGYFLGKPKEL